MHIPAALRWRLILTLCVTLITSDAQAADDKFPPPWGAAMPPDVIKIVPLNRLEINTPRILDNYPAWHRYYPKDKIIKTGRMYLWTEGYRNPKGWRIDFSLRDGEHQVIGGQVYQFEFDKNRLVRIPNHPLMIPPERSVDLFTIGIQGSVNITKSGIGIDVELTSIRKKGDSDKPDTHIICSIGGDLVTSSTETIKRYETKGMAVGDVIETEEFSLKLEAIVPKDEKARIPGWVHFRRIPKPKSE